MQLKNYYSHFKNSQRQHLFIAAHIQYSLQQSLYRDDPAQKNP